MINNQKEHISALLTTTQTFRATIIVALFFGYGLVLAYAWADLLARPVIFALYTLLALLGVALLLLYRQTLTWLCCTQQQAKEEETEAIQQIRDALLVENDVDGLPRLVVLDGQHGVCVLTPDDPDYSRVADHVVRLCPQVASLLKRADGESISHEHDHDSDNDGGQFPHPGSVQR